MNAKSKELKDACFYSRAAYMAADDAARALNVACNYGWKAVDAAPDKSAERAARADAARALGAARDNILDAISEDWGANYFYTHNNAND